MFKFSFQVESEEESALSKDEMTSQKSNENETRAEDTPVYPCEELCVDTILVGPRSINPEVTCNFTPVPECSIAYLNHLALLEETFTDDIVTAELDHSDLVPNRYEGGLKVWECTFDLGKFLVSSEDLKALFQGKKVLDLGCGAGVLGIEAIQLGASSVHFQDYNKDVLTKTTMINYDLNCRSDDKNGSDVPVAAVKFFSGDWGSFTDNYDEKYDIILTSETIYSTQNYGKLLQLFDRKLEADGIIYLAAKTYYFGVGGGVRLFEDALASDDRFQCETVWKCDIGVKREILKISRK
ncbi:histidine protein methyltransferase 1 homolog [Anopheles ziemanni]|uniref:histidine protein methyltransferase 1 homolog n=1 Tax=Anopheles ziemanni TaxID=345580 RepID=UPI00265E21C3|nr:histidine protein methyltransferase 1 homolog [Anopheles ziemanni]